MSPQKYNFLLTFSQNVSFEHGNRPVFLYAGGKIPGRRLGLGGTVLHGKGRSYRPEHFHVVVPVADGQHRFRGDMALLQAVEKVACTTFSRCS